MSCPLGLALLNSYGYNISFKVPGQHRALNALKPGILCPAGFKISLE
jgi:hypothetical protein